MLKSTARPIAREIATASMILSFHPNRTRIATVTKIIEATVMLAAVTEKCIHYSNFTFHFLLSNH